MSKPIDAKPRKAVKNMTTRKIYAQESIAGMNALVFTPDSNPHNAFEALPLIVYLHGAGERGSNHEHLYRHGIPKLISEGYELPAVVLVPQCPAWAVWDNVVRELKTLIDTIILQYGIKRDRITLTGASMGGFGTWMTGITYPNFFAGIAPVAGGGMSWRACKLCTTPVFAVHGECDTDVPIEYSKMMVAHLDSENGMASLTVLPGLGHNDGIDYAYRHTELIRWLIRQRRTDFGEVKEVCSDLF